MEPMTTDPKPEDGGPREKSKLSSREEFETALSTVEKLVASQALWWKLSFPSSIFPRLDEQAASPVIGPKDSDTRKPPVTG